MKAIGFRGPQGAIGFAYFCLDGSTEQYFDESWKMDDIVMVPGS
jgi:hypothetical protein